MCKIFGIAGLNKQSSPAAFSLLQAATPLLTENDKDGFGYAAFSLSGKFWAERWLNPKEAWRTRQPVEAPPGMADMLYCGADDQYAAHGESTRYASAIIAHARMATCRVSLANVHPFIKEVDGLKDAKTLIALVHNGVVHGKLDTSGSDSCDSMGILNAYAEARIDTDPDMIRFAFDNVYGSYACMVLGKDADGAPYLDVWRNSGSSLYVCKVQTVGLVWCTSAEIVRKAAKKARLAVFASWEVKENKLLRVHARTGAVMHKESFEPAAYSWQSSSSSSSSPYSQAWDWENSEYEYNAYGKRVPAQSRDVTQPRVFVNSGEQMGLKLVNGVNNDPIDVGIDEGAKELAAVWGVDWDAADDDDKEALRALSKRGAQ